MKKMNIQLMLMTLMLPIYYCQIDFQTICHTGIRQDNTNYIHCGRKELNDIPNFSRTTNTFYDELVLTNNQIHEIGYNAFQGLRVKRLNLSGNKIRFIDHRAFRELANYLEELIIDFSSTHVHDVPDAIKFNLINLRSLRLKYLNLTTIKNNTFIKYRKLEELSIEESHIKHIELNGFNSLTHLRSLRLDRNQLTDDSWFVLTKYLNHLEILSLSYNNFYSLKDQFILKNFKFLDLSSNRIQMVEKTFFEKISSIETLHLQNNEINSLQLTFLQLLNNLTELNLDFNRLTFLPENIFQFNTKLTNLSLQGNDLNYLTNKAFRGLKNLTRLNLARNRLQFSFNQQPFQDLNSLESLNLDRNIHLNISRLTFTGLETTLLDLSLQNCNLTSISLFNNPFDSFVNLQRLKLSSNNLSELPDGILKGLVNSLVSIDLQRNSFRSIPYLFGKGFMESRLTDIDLSWNHICSLNKSDLYRYKNLKVINLYGNPLHCDCHLRWLTEWLVKHYDYDFIQYLRWTCSTPMTLAGKELTTIDEHDMICLENDYSQCQDVQSLTIRSTSTQLTSTTATSTSTVIDELIISDISYNPNGMLSIKWECTFSILPRYFHLKIYDDISSYLLLQLLIDGEQRSVEINITDHLNEGSSNYMICLHVRQNKYCRAFQLQQIKSPSLMISSNELEAVPPLRFLYLLGGILLGAIVVCLMLIIVCCWRIRRLSKEKLSNSIEKVHTPLYHPPPHSSIFYRPLNIISYPPQKPNQQHSCDTSECSMHSSTDTSQLTNDSYHVYQQIPSVYNCQIHPTRTHILV